MPGFKGRHRGGIDMGFHAILVYVLFAALIVGLVIFGEIYYRK